MNSYGFPVWISLTHYLNILFLVFLARTGLQILASFPRLYLKDGCAPGHEFLKFTRRQVPEGKLHQSLDEEANVPAWLAMPGGKGATGGLGVGRHLHFVSLLGWIATGAVYVALLFLTGEWARLVPNSWSLFPDAVHSASEYLHFRLPAPRPGYPYNALQQLAYFAVVFLLTPLQIATGAAMSPALIGRFPRYTSLFGGRQAARTLHFFGLLAFTGFVLVHTFMVVIHGLPKEWARIVLASETADRRLAVVVGCLGLLALVALNAGVTIWGRRQPRAAQHFLGNVVDPLQRQLSHRFPSRQRYRPSDITSYFWINGYPPPDPVYRVAAERGFAGWRLRVGGQVERQLDLSLSDLRRLPVQRQITRHNCIQGWTGVAEWKGVPMRDFIELCRPLANARFVVFYAYDDKALTQTDAEGLYYETLDLKLAAMPQTLLAYEFNGRPLPVEHGAPLRLRVEGQLGFKMVKWIRAIAFVPDYADIGLGQGGWREDHAFYSPVVGI